MSDFKKYKPARALCIDMALTVSVTPIRIYTKRAENRK